MALAHIGDVLYGSDSAGCIEFEIDRELSREVGYHRCLLVLVTLAYHANEHNLAWPSAGTISRAVGFDVRKVRVCLKVLERSRLITRIANQRVGKRGITYHLNLPSFDQVEPQYCDESRHVVHSGPEGVPLEKPEKGSVDSTPDSTQMSTPPYTKGKDKDKVKEEVKLDHLKYFEIPFEDFWDLYPSKFERGHAFVAWQTCAQTPGLTLAIFFALKGQLDSNREPISSDWPPAHVWLASEPWKHLGKEEA